MIFGGGARRRQNNNNNNNSSSSSSSSYNSSFGGGGGGGGRRQPHSQSSPWQQQQQQQQQRSREICRNFARGHCRFGSQCRFSHDLSGNNVGNGRDVRQYLDDRRQSSFGGGGGRSGGRSHTYRHGDGTNDADMDDEPDAVGPSHGGMRFGSAAGKKVVRGSTATGSSGFGSGGGSMGFSQPAPQLNQNAQMTNSHFGGGGFGGGMGAFAQPRPQQFGVAAAASGFGTQQQQQQQQHFGSGGFASDASPFKQHFRTQGGGASVQHSGFGAMAQPGQAVAASGSPFGQFAHVVPRATGPAQNVGSVGSDGALGGPIPVPASNGQDDPEGVWSAADFAVRKIPEAVPPPIHCR